MAQARCEGFEHGSASYLTSSNVAAWLTTQGSPAVDAAYALSGTYGARVGRGGQNDDYFEVPSGLVANGVSQHLLDFGIMVKSHSEDDKSIWIIQAFASDGLVVGSLGYGTVGVRRESGPVYYFMHGTTKIYQFTIDTEYRLRYYLLADGTNIHIWLWICDASNNLLAHNYFVDAEADTEISLKFGCINAGSQKVDFDAWIDHIVWAGSEDSTTYDCPYWTLKPGIYVGSPNADDATENDYIDTGSGPVTFDDVAEIPPSTAEWAVWGTDGALQLWTQDIAEPVGYTPLSVGLGEVFKLVPTATANAFHHFRIKSGANVSESSEALGTTIRYYAKWFQADPGGGPWTPALVNALLIGMRYEQGDAVKTHLVYHAIIQVPCVVLDTPPTPGAAMPIFSKDGIHSLVFGGQVITGGA